jgi:hypothetical protein
MKPETPWRWDKRKSDILDGVMGWIGIVLLLLGSVYCAEMFPLSGLGCVASGTLICWRFR